MNLKNSCKASIGLLSENTPNFKNLAYFSKPNPTPHKSRLYSPLHHSNGTCSIGKDSSLIYEKLKSSKLTTIVLLFFLTTTACHKTDHDIVNLNGNHIEALGHAGMGVKNAYPINSFESITKALVIGADGTEMDVQLSADGVLVLFHDQNLNNSTNKSGIINDLNWAEIEGAYYNTIPYHDYQIIQLQSVLANIDNIQDYRLALDCKLYSSQSDSLFFQQYAFELLRLLALYEMPEKTIIESPDPKLLQIIHELGGPYQLFWYTNNIPTNLAEAENWPIHGFTLRHDQANAADIQAAHDKGYFVTLYNTQSKSENLSAIEKNPDMIQSDALRHLVEVLK